eukprot:3319544-Heterocapsa_arctica.AAC.1
MVHLLSAAPAVRRWGEELLAMAEASARTEKGLPGGGEESWNDALDAVAERRDGGWKLRD